MKQLAFYFDSSACSGCKTCQVACRDKHDLGKGMLWRRVYEVAGGEWKKEGEAWVPDIYSYYVSMACNHCEEPSCMTACPNGAIFKDGRGLVLIDGKRCMGCRYCEWTCPYGALFYDAARGVMTKCTMCADYIEQGKPPACVSACPMRVLEAGDLEEMRENLRRSLTGKPAAGDLEEMREKLRRTLAEKPAAGSPGDDASGIAVDVVAKENMEAGTGAKAGVDGAMERHADGSDGRPSMYPLPDPEITRPALVVRPHPHALRAAREKLKINNREEVRDA